MTTEIEELIPATTEESKEIRAINKDTVHKICSGQVVVTLAIAVKELVENAIDAGATTIEVRLKEYGSELVEVIDNGSGVEEHNYEALTLKHYTSKIKEFSDLSFVSTLGFRGEALSSLCALCDLSVVTRYKTAEIGVKIEYDHNGRIKSKNLCARQVGTTVQLANLFNTLPVRLKDFHKNLKREFAKMLELLYAYCLITDVRIICSNQTKKSPRTLCVNTHGSKSIKDNIISVFGIKQMDTLIPFELHRPEEDILEEYKLRLVPGDPIPYTFEGFISKCSHSSGRSSSDREFYFINGRPCEPTKLSKLINQVYRSFNGNQYPFVVLNIKTEQCQVDVNVTPDKRQIFLEQEKLLLATAKQSLWEMFKEFPSTLKMQNTKLNFSNSTESSQESNGNISGLDMFRHLSQKNQVLNEKRGIKRCKETNLTKKAKGILSFIHEKRQKIDQDKSLDLSDNSASEDEEKQVKKFIKDSYNSCDSDEDLNISTQDITDNLLDTLTDLSKENSYTKNKTVSKESDEDSLDISSQEATKSLVLNLSALTDYSEKETSTPKSSTSSFEEFSSCTPRKSIIEYTVDITVPEPESNCIEILYDAPILKNSTPEVSSNTIDASISEIQNLITKNQKIKESKQLEENNIIKFRSEITSKNAEDELQKQISKDMFEKMDILGQFNKGFIITKFENDLFIIDQHATDEKYNFETLQKRTILQNQKLVVPLPLDLTAANENLLVDNLEIFTKNGFSFNIDENAEPRKKICLTAIPMSKNYQFGKEDIDELLFMLQEDSLNSSYRPSRVRAMFASRACRKSVMIGSDLSLADMKKLVNHMGQIDQPWNCPHGRPTLRHLINLNLIQK